LSTGTPGVPRLAWQPGLRLDRLPTVAYPCTLRDVSMSKEAPSMRLRGIRLSILSLFFLLLTSPPIAVSQESDPTGERAREMEAMQKKLQDVQGKSTTGAKESSLKRRDLKGQPLSQSQGAQEGLTPEQQKMYDELMQQMEQIKESKKKQGAALEELMKGEGSR
jgi:hypothetical protein